MCEREREWESEWVNKRGEKDEGRNKMKKIKIVGIKRLTKTNNIDKHEFII